MQLLGFLHPKTSKSAPAAKKRLQLIIARKRDAEPITVFLPVLGKELAEVIGKYARVNVQDIKISSSCQGTVKMLGLHVILE